MTKYPNQIATGMPYATDDDVRMRGTAIHGGYFDVPLIQMVADFGFQKNIKNNELWQGGCLNGFRLPEDFDFVLSLYPWEKYELGPDTERVEVTMYDDLGQGFDQVQELADGLVQRINDGQKVLVHCQAGLNRSGLLSACTLVKLGYRPSDAIDLLREKRCDQVLCNGAFENYVRGLDAPGHKNEAGDEPC